MPGAFVRYVAQQDLRTCHVNAGAPNSSISRARCFDHVVRVWLSPAENECVSRSRAKPKGCEQLPQGGRHLQSDHTSVLGLRSLGTQPNLSYAPTFVIGRLQVDIAPP